MVLDPFIGSGIVAVVAEAHRRDWVGIELNPEYIELADTRIADRRQRSDRVEEPPPPGPTA
ncbi:MAG: hypothetical protein ABS81_08370 [Pseudonocardia sp. SCN 72-86]|nr:MAG: hypothetical protein ABS81_08370 [Pseudonocardia sp. SCN 72-86]